ncbi:MAG: phosphoribosyltransferase domain-containing protein, partial [Specibacter sp.]
MTGTVPAPWTGGYVADALDVRIHSDPASAVAVEELVGLALRRNPKRAHLLVSTVLAKHIPTEPGLVVAAGELLGAFVARKLAGDAAAEVPGHDAGAG